VPPAPGGFPDASTTGPNGTLTAYTGPLTITTAGTVIANRQINGCIRIEAPRVIIRNSRIACNNFSGVYSPTVRATADRALLEDVEIDCLRSNGTGVVGHSIVVRRADIHDCENGAHADQFMTIEHSWIHAPFNGNGAHADGVQVSIGLRGMVLFHNRIEIPNGTSTLIADVAIHSMTVDSNFLSGGSYTLYCSTSFSSFETVTNNVWLASERQPAANDYPYRPFTLCDKSGTTFTGNTWSDGRPLTKDPATHVD